MTTPLFSIVIPTYNSEAVIGRAIDSVLTQTFTSFEILIVDGVSSDNTLDIVRKYQDTRLRVICEKDKGVYDAMNKGLAKATGEWLYFLGSDDYLWDNEVLAKIQELLQKHDVDFIYGNVFSPDYGENYDGEFDTMKLLKQNICHQAIFCKRSVFDKVGIFNIDYTAHADYDFSLKCFFNKSIRKMYVPLKIAYFAPGGVSIKMRNDLFKQNINKIIVRYGWRDLPESVLKRYYKSKSLYLIDLIKRKLSLPPPQGKVY